MAMKFGDALVSETTEKSYRPAIFHALALRLHILDQPEQGLSTIHLRAAILRTSISHPQTSATAMSAPCREDQFSKDRALRGSSTRTKSSEWDPNQTTFDPVAFTRSSRIRRTLKTAEDNLAATIRDYPTQSGNIKGVRSLQSALSQTAGAGNAEPSL